MKGLAERGGRRKRVGADLVLGQGGGGGEGARENGGGRWCDGGGDAEEGGDLRNGVGLAPVVAVIVAVTRRDEHFGFGGPVRLWLAETPNGRGEEAFEGGGLAERESEVENGVGAGIERAAN